MALGYSWASAPHFVLVNYYIRYKEKNLDGHFRERQMANKSTRSSSDRCPSATETYKVEMGDILNHSDDTMYLGFLLNIQLSWKKQVDMIKSAIMKYTSIFCKLRHDL